jgi:glucose/arabinose dehydrogenase
LDAQLHVPDGFRVEKYAAGLRDPRVLLTAPNGDIFVAFHGSWNCSRRTGYKIVRVPMDGGKAQGIMRIS